MSNANVYGVYEKRNLIQRISIIGDKRCYRAIFKLLIERNIDYANNSNGIFFNILPLSDSILREIDSILFTHELFKEKISINNV